MDWFCASENGRKDDLSSLLLCARRDEDPGGFAAGGSGVADRCAREAVERARLRPRLGAAEAAALAANEFGLEVETATELGSRRDRNFRITTRGGGAAFVLKVHNGFDSGDAARLEAHTALYAHAAARDFRAPTEARPLRRVRLAAAAADAEESCLPLAEAAPPTYALRLLAWVPGDDVFGREVTPATCRARGAFLADARAMLDGFDHIALHSASVWDARQFPALAPVADALVDRGCEPSKAALVARAMAAFDAVVAPVAAALPLATIHNDFCDARRPPRAVDAREPKRGYARRRVDHRRGR